MNPFAETVATWHDFYMMVGTAAATLVGLLFVGLSLNIEAIRRKESADLQRLAALTFSSFIYVLLFAVVFLIPKQVPLGLGLPLIGTGAAGLYSTIVLYRATRGSHRAWGRGTIARRFAVPMLCMLGVIVIGLFVLLGQTDALYWLVPVMLVLLAFASRNAWDLLLGIRQMASVETRSVARARVKWLSTEEGGRIVAFQGLRYAGVADFNEKKDQELWSLVAEFDEPPPVSTEIVARVYFLVEWAPLSLLHSGSKFKLIEGRRTVALGEVLGIDLGDVK